MAELSLPASPSDGDTVTHEGTKFTYNATAGRWTRELLSSRIETVVPSTNTSVTATSVTGNTLVFTQADGSTANVDLSALAGGSVTTYATESDLPSDADNGSHGYVTATTFLYIKATSGWYKINSVNLTPAVTVSSNTAAFSAESQTIEVTYTVAEPEDTPVTITVSNTGISNTDQVTITHTEGNNTVSIVSGNTELSGGTITISASDGVNIGTGTISVDLSLGVTWAGETSAQLFTPGLGSDPIRTGAVGFDGSVLDLSDDGLVALSTGYETANNFGGFVVWKNTSGDSSNNNSWEHYHTQVGLPFTASANGDFTSMPTVQSGTPDHKHSWGRHQLDFRLSANGSVVIAPFWSQSNTSYWDNASRVGMYVIDISNTSNISDHSSFNHYAMINTTGYGGSGAAIVNSRDIMANYIDFDDDLNYMVYTWDNYRVSSSSITEYGKIIIVSRSGSTWSNSAELYYANTTVVATAGQSIGAAHRLGYSGAYMNSTGDKVVAATPSLFKHYGNHGTYGASDGPQGGVLTFVRSGSTWSEAANGHLYDLTGGTTNYASSMHMSKDGNYLAVYSGHGFNGWKPPGNVAVAQTPLGSEGCKIYAWNSSTSAWDYQTVIRPSDSASGNPTYTQSMGISQVRLNNDGTLLFMTSKFECIRIYKRTGSTWTFVTAHEGHDIEANGHDFSSNNSLTGPSNHYWPRVAPKAFAIDGDGRNYFYSGYGQYSSTKKGDGTTIIQST